MFSISIDSYNNSYIESSVNDEIDSISNQFVPNGLAITTNLNATCFQKHFFVCWHDQRRISKCLLSHNNYETCFLFIKPRLEFILTYDFESFLMYIRDYSLAFLDNKLNSVNIVLSDSSQETNFLAQLPIIPGITWTTNL